MVILTQKSNDLFYTNSKKQFIYSFKKVQFIQKQQTQMIENTQRNILNLKIF